MTHFNFALLSETHLISLSMLFNISLNLIIEAIERFKQLLKQHYKEPVNRQFEDSGTKEVRHVSGVETESSSDEEDLDITTE